jgi:hypothetical protein
MPNRLVMKIGDKSLELEQEAPFDDSSVKIVQQYVNALGPDPAQPGINEAAASLDQSTKQLRAVIDQESQT